MATAASKTRERGPQASAIQREGASPLTAVSDLQPTILARKFLDEADGDMDRATAAMAEHVLTSPQLLRAHLGKLVGDWCRDRIRNAIADRREHILAVNAGAQFAEGLRTAIGNDYTRLMDMPIYGGKRLGDATAAEVRESAQRYFHLAKDCSQKARRQEAVAAAAEKNGSPEAPISNALSENTLKKLWEEANAD